MKPKGNSDIYIGDIYIAYNKARAIDNEWQQAEALAQLGPRLPVELLIQAMTISRDFADDWAQGVALAALTPRLAELGYSAEALQSIAATRRGFSRAKALQAAMPYLPESVYNEATALANSIQQPENRAAAWMGIVPYLQDDAQVEAIQTAQAAVEAIVPGPIQMEAQTELDALVERLGYLWDEALDDDQAELPAPVATEADETTPLQAAPQAPRTPHPAVIEIPVAEIVPTHAQVNAAARATLTWLNRRLVGLGLNTGQLAAHPNLAHYLAWTENKHLGGLQLAWLLPLLISMVCVTSLFLSGLFIGGIIVAASPQSVETLSLASDGGSIISRTSLSDGQMYTIVVSGRFRYNASQPESWADAQSTYFQQTDSWVPAYWVSIDGQKVVAQQADTGQHLYLFYIGGQNRPLKFRIEERRSTEYVDNDGALLVDIYPGVVALEEIQ